MAADRARARQPTVGTRPNCNCAGGWTGTLCDAAVVDPAAAIAATTPAPATPPPSAAAPAGPVRRGMGALGVWPAAAAAAGVLAAAAAAAAG